MCEHGLDFGDEEMGDQQQQHHHHHQHHQQQASSSKSIETRINISACGAVQEISCGYAWVLLLIVPYGMTAISCLNTAIDGIIRSADFFSLSSPVRVGADGIPTGTLPVRR